ncbi:MAG: hypothetical protein PHE06_01490 [Lachnospiraceae bacterium]|nr:hypothetical protein [Lachnospiraceae bacterium]
MVLLQELDLIDRFLFDEVMEAPEVHQAVLEIIMITPYDLFGYGKYQYTFQPVCKGAPGLQLEDGTKQIFLNTKGRNPEDVSEEKKEEKKGAGRN